ncbi:MAG: carboxymuconolactone decarboxylase family protein [Terasakiella sp.]|uniref:carboxymuconolactone decarboxylase family protein n=1 Tax=unclassified Terasakiella TaxID=2614952 RepID=UPI003AFFA09B
MSRIAVIKKESATTEQGELLDAIQAKLGMVPNFLGVFAQSPDALKAFLGLHSIAENGTLDAQTRERIALAVAQGNACEYCLSAHSAIGRKAGLNNAEIDANRKGTSFDAKAAAAVSFAKALNNNMGDVTQAEFDSVRTAGFSDSDIVEIITHVGMNILTNLLGKATHVDIDFPKVELAQAAE